MLLGHLGGASEGEKLVVNPSKEVVDSFRCWDDVERRRNSSSVLKVGNPKLTAGKLPLCVGLLLELNHKVSC